MREWLGMLDFKSHIHLSLVVLSDMLSDRLHFSTPFLCISHGTRGTEQSLLELPRAQQEQLLLCIATDTKKVCDSFEQHSHLY